VSLKYFIITGCAVAQAPC